MTRLLTLLLVLVTSGCGINYGNDDTWESTVKAARPLPVRTKRVYLRSFQTSLVSGRSTVVGSGYTGTAETVTTSDRVHPWLLELVREQLPFRAVVPSDHMGPRPDYILQGSLSFEWQMPWWSWVQLLDLWIHAWFVPTLGRHLEMDFELSLYDGEFRFLRKWRCHRTAKHIADVWYLIFHGGAGGSGHEKPYREFLRAALAKVGHDLTAQEAKLVRERRVMEGR